MSTVADVTSPKNDTDEAPKAETDLEKFMRERAAKTDDFADRLERLADAMSEIDPADLESTR